MLTLLNRLQREGLTYITRIYIPPTPNTFLLLEMPNYHHLPRPPTPYPE